MTTWFIGSITNEEARGGPEGFDFLDSDKQYRAIIYEDGPGADFETNPYPMTIRQEQVTKASTLKPGSSPVVVARRLEFPKFNIQL